MKKKLKAGSSAHHCYESYRTAMAGHESYLLPAFWLNGLATSCLRTWLAGETSWRPAGSGNIFRFQLNKDGAYA